MNWNNGKKNFTQIIIVTVMWESIRASFRIIKNALRLCSDYVISIILAQDNG